MSLGHISYSAHCPFCQTAEHACGTCATPEACTAPINLFNKEPGPMLTDWDNHKTHIDAHKAFTTKVDFAEPDVNPKELRAAADGKAPLEYLEPAGEVETAYVMQHGAEKYGRRNYTVTPCKILTYVGAVQRHLRAIRLGEDVDPDSGRSHWAHIRACADVVMGADDAGMLVDDREAYATALSDRVHVEGDTDAKALRAADPARIGATAGICPLPVGDACMCRVAACNERGYGAVFTVGDRTCR